MVCCKQNQIKTHEQHKCNLALMVFAVTQTSPSFPMANSRIQYISALPSTLTNRYHGSYWKLCRNPLVSSKFHSTKTAVNLMVNAGTSFTPALKNFRGIFSMNSQHWIRRPDPQNSASSVSLVVAKFSKELSTLYSLIIFPPPFFCEGRGNLTLFRISAMLTNMEWV